LGRIVGQSQQEVQRINKDNIRLPGNLFLPDVGRQGDILDKYKLLRYLSRLSQLLAETEPTVVAGGHEGKGAKKEVRKEV
jgi:hypothetical protein